MVVVMDIQKLTKEQAVIITGFTGILCGSFSDFHADVEKRLDRGVQTFEMGVKSFMDEVKKLYEDDFYKIATFCVDQAKTIPEGFVLVPVKEIKTWYLDDSENIYREDPDWLCDIAIGEVVEVEHRVSYELDQDPVFATIQWDDENGDVGYYRTFKSKAEAEKIAAHCKAMNEVQEPAND